MDHDKNKSGLFQSVKDAESFFSLCKDSVFPPLDLTKYNIPEEVLDYIPERIAHAYGVIPVSKNGTVITVAISDPFNILLVDNLRLITHMEISPVISLPAQIHFAIDKYYSLDRQEEEGVNTYTDEKKKESSDLISLKEKKFDLEKVTQLSKQAKVVKAVNMILSDAVKLRTSDIHIEPFENNVRVRYRIDGVLHEVKKIDKKYKEAVLARLKLMSRLDITQRKIPQDGRFGFKVSGKDIDVRVSILPVDFGEKIVMRLLDRASIKLDIESLGFSDYALKSFKTALEKPFGVVLLTGPTGSGKTTTLYSILNGLNTFERNIVTIEDPVEYNLSGITQVPVRHEIDLGFADILKATLRQSPDIIMVGEIRDFETVDIALKAALTGHIVLSTLHTNDAPSAITRLLNMGIEPFLISSSLNMIAAQRLVRKICGKCKESYKMDLTATADIPLQYKAKDVILYKGKGCPACGSSGYKGRIAVVEALSFDQTLRDMVMKRSSVEEVQKYAMENLGMKTLREDAMDKCLRGETTFDEMLRVTVEF